MKKLRLIWTISLCLLVKPLPSYAYTFSISPPLGTHETSNVSGLAVNPVNNNVFLTSLSYTGQGGTDNLWEFTSTGILVNSTRTVFDTGPTGNLGSIAIGSDGHLFMTASYSDPDICLRSIIEMSQDGNTIYSSFSTDQYFGGVFGITYNSIDDQLIIATGRVGSEFVIREMMPDGTLLSSSRVDKDSWGYDIAFDALTGNLFSIRGNLLHEFSRSASGAYYLINTHDISSITSRGFSGMDISRTTGLFYVSTNTTVYEFDRNGHIITTPLPAAIWLFGSGLLGLMGISRCKKKP